MPICSTCHEDKPPQAFALRSKATGELQSHCRTCHAAYRRQHYVDNRAIYIAREVARINGYRVANRALIVAYLATHPCVDCGETDVVVLEFDHRDPASKRSEVSVLAVHKPWHIVLAEIEKCDVRCVNCHRRRTAAQFQWKKAAPRTSAAAPGPPVAVTRSAMTLAPQLVAECARCFGIKPLDEFSIKNKKTGRRSRICKTCVAAASRRHYAKNKDAYISRNRQNKKRYRKQNRRLMLELLDGKSCVDCGESDPTVLEFDHRDGTQKESEIGRLVGSGRWSKVAAEIEKCDIRCGNCHRRRTARQFGWTKLRLQQGLSEDSDAYVAAIQFDLPLAGVM